MNVFGVRHFLTSMIFKRTHPSKQVFNVELGFAYIYRESAVANASVAQLISPSGPRSLGTVLARKMLGISM